MYIVLIKKPNDEKWSYLTINKNIIDNLDRSAIMDVWSTASSLARMFPYHTVKILSLTDFLLSPIGMEAFEKFLSIHV